jgi:hypothetical protein
LRYPTGCTHAIASVPDDNRFPSNRIDIDLSAFLYRAMLHVLPFDKHGREDRRLVTSNRIGYSHIRTPFYPTSVTPLSHDP